MARNTFVHLLLALRLQHNRVVMIQLSARTFTVPEPKDMYRLSVLYKTHASCVEVNTGLKLNTCYMLSDTIPGT